MSGLLNSFWALAPSVSAYLGLSSPSVVGSVATATGVNFGAPSPNRLICVSILWTSTSVLTLVSATIGGIPAVIVTTEVTGPSIGGSFYQTALITAIVPSGTSGTIVANLSGTGAGASFFVFSATNISSATPFSVAAPQAGAVSVLNTTVDQATGGVTFAEAAIVSGTLSLTGVATDYSFAGSAAGGSQMTPLAVTAAPISATAAGTTFRSLIAASFR